MKQLKYFFFLTAFAGSICLLSCEGKSHKTKSMENGPYDHSPETNDDDNNSPNDNSQDTIHSNK